MAGGERRPARVGHLLQAELGRLLVEDARNPLLRQVIVTAVRVTPDLRLARVWFRTLGAADAVEPTAKALERAAAYLRGEVGRTLGMRVTPELRFAYDETPDTGRRVEALLAGKPDPGEDDGR